MMYGRYNEQMVLLHNTKSVYFEYFCQYVDQDSLLSFTIEFDRGKFMNASRELLHSSKCTIESLDSMLYLQRSGDGLAWNFAQDQRCYTNLNTSWQPEQLLTGRMLTHRNNNYNLP